MEAALPSSVTESARTRRVVRNTHFASEQNVDSAAAQPGRTSGAHWQSANPVQSCWNGTFDSNSDWMFPFDFCIPLASEQRSLA
eukprot:2953051-Amphidinium_carterae.1